MRKISKYIVRIKLNRIPSNIAHPNAPPSTTAYHSILIFIFFVTLFFFSLKQSYIKRQLLEIIRYAPSQNDFFINWCVREQFSLSLFLSDFCPSLFLFFPFFPFSLYSRSSAICTRRNAGWAMQIFKIFRVSTD